MDVVVKWIFVVSFLDLFAVSLLIPLMSSHLKELGASHFLIGCMTSIYALAQLISGPIIVSLIHSPGSWSDRIGRQQILFSSLVAVSCCYICLGLINALFVLLIVRAISGIMDLEFKKKLGAFKHTQVLIRAIIADRVSVDQQTLVFGYLKAVAGISFTVGPAIGGNVVELKNGFAYLCYCVGGFFLLNSAIVYYFVNDIPAIKAERNASSLKPTESDKTNNSILQAIRDLGNIDWPIYWDVFALKFLMDFSIGAFHNNYNLKLKEKFDMSPKMSGYTISVQSFIGVLTGLLVDRVNQRFYRDDIFYKKRNMHGYVIMMIAYVGLAITESLSIFMIWSMLLRSVHMFLRIIMGEMTINRCPPDKKGSIIGSSNSMSNIARLITPLLTGFMEDLWGSNSSNVLAATAASFGVLVLFKLRHRKEKIS